MLSLSDERTKLDDSFSNDALFSHPPPRVFERPNLWVRAIKGYTYVNSNHEDSSVSNLKNVKFQLILSLECFRT